MESKVNSSDPEKQQQSTTDQQDKTNTQPKDVSQEMDNHYKQEYAELKSKEEEIKKLETENEESN